MTTPKDCKICGTEFCWAGVGGRHIPVETSSLSLEDWVVVVTRGAKLVLDASRHKVHDCEIKERNRLRALELYNKAQSAI